MKDAAPLFDWINERHAIYLRKAAITGEDLPAWADPAGFEVEGRWSFGNYTDDPVLQEYRFTNVFRELDRVTVWIRERIREPFAEHRDLWFMLAIARYINWPETLAEVMEVGAWPDRPGFEPADLTQALEARRARGEKMETGAYMIRAESDPKRPWYEWSKQRYVSEIVLGKLWESRDEWRRLIEGAGTLQEVWDRLRRCYGWGAFMAYQVVLDMRHTRLLGDAADVNTWAAVGPGSARGLNRLAGRPLNRTVPQERGVQEMRRLLEISPEYLAPWVPALEMEDVQNACCETDKHLRTKNGEGKPRARYRPGASAPEPRTGDLFAAVGS